MRGLVARGSCHLPPKIPHYIQRLTGKEAGKLSWGAWVPRLLALLTTPLQHVMEGFVLKCTPLHLCGQTQLPFDCWAGLQLPGSLKAFPVLRANGGRQGDPEIPAMCDVNNPEATGNLYHGVSGH